MTIHIARPKLMFGLVTLVLLALVSTAVLAEGGGTRFSQPTGIRIGDSSELPAVTEAERDTAVQALRSNGVFQQLSEGRTWQVVEALPNTREGQKIGTGLLINLEPTAESAGPWVGLACQGTVSYEFSFAYEGISTVGAVFDDSGKLIKLTPVPSETLRFDNAAPPVMAFSGTCPKGKEDGSN